MCVWTVTLFVRGQRAIAGAPVASPGREDAFTWVFLVAALNEEITIGDSVERLLALELANRKVIVIDDGSDDATPEILAGFSDPDLYVLRRDLPDARKGKAQALNAAYHCIGQGLPGVDRERVIVVVVDADGRIAPDGAALRRGALRGSGGRRRPGARAHLQPHRLPDADAGRRVLASTAASTRPAAIAPGRPGMGGNGQFNRLSALDADRRGRRAVAQPADRGSGPRPAPARRRLEVAPGAAGRRRAAGRPAPAPAAAPAHPLGAGQPAGARPARRDLALAVPAAGACWDEVLSLLMPLWQTIVGAALRLRDCARGARNGPDHALRGDPARDLRPRLLERRARLPRDAPREGPGAGCGPSASPTSTRSTRGCCFPVLAARARASAGDAARLGAHRPGAARVGARVAGARAIVPRGLARCGRAAAAAGRAPAPPLRERGGGAGDAADEGEEPDPEQVEDDGDDPDHISSLLVSLRASR